MIVEGKHYRTIWLKEGDDGTAQIIDQTQLPHKFVIEDIRTVEEMAAAIKYMHVRGAGLIGAAAAYGMHFAAQRAPDDSFDESVEKDAEMLKATRPTAVNLAWAVDRQLKAIARGRTPAEKKKIAFDTARKIADEDAKNCRLIGQHGLKMIEEISKKKKGRPVNILTHCNAGWLAFVDYGSALSPVYAAFDRGIKVHVWVDETRPWNQGSRLTAWELGQHGVPHTIIPDNTGGHLMQHKMVDMVIVGADRVTREGDAANKIGTYLKALAAKANRVPFYVALPSSTFDWKIRNGIREIPIEQRGADEVKYISGLCEDKRARRMQLTPENSPAANYAFDVTPSRLITGLITERGMISPVNEKTIVRPFPEKSAASMAEKDGLKRFIVKRPAKKRQ
jgi:methylthioribose-1-phosphate isomerase